MVNKKNKKSTRNVKKTKNKREEREENVNEKEENMLISDFTRFYLLVLLYEQPLHGYLLKKKYEERLNKKISYSLIYNFLTKLEKHGYVEMNLEMVGQKEKKIYNFNDKGKKFAEKLFERFSGIMDTAIEPNIQICAGCGIRLYKNSYQEKIDGKVLNFCCVHCAQAYKDGKQHLHTETED